MKLFFLCLYSYHAYFILSLKSEKCVTKRNKRESSKRIHWLKKPVLVSCWLDHWKWLMPDLMGVVLSNREGLDRFSRYVLPELSKTTVTCPQWVKGPKRMNFDLPKVSKININFELLKVSKVTSLKIYISPVTEKLQISNLDTWYTSLKEFHWVLCLRW